MARNVGTGNQRTMKSSSEPVKQAFFVKASISRVFEAISDSKILLRWFLTKAELEPKVGGRYHFEWITGFTLTGRVSKYRKNKALAYTFGSEADIVSFELSKRGSGTLLKVRDGTDDPESLVSRAGHWAYYLMNLKSVLENGADLRSKLDWEGGS